MGVIAAPVERRRDGKLHPVGGRRSDAELARAVALVHVLRCRDHLSYPKIVRALESYGLRVSQGSVHAYATKFECDRCAEPEPSARAARPQQHQPEPGRGRRQQGTTGGCLAQSVVEPMEGE